MDAEDADLASGFEDLKPRESVRRNEIDPNLLIGLLTGSTGSDRTGFKGSWALIKLFPAELL